MKREYYVDLSNFFLLQKSTRVSLNYILCNMYYVHSILKKYW